MFRTAEVGRKLQRAEYDQVAPALRIELIELQQRLRRTGVPAIVVFAGVDGAGKGRAINLINEWLDPRWIATRAYGPPSDEERERPEFWRYWRDLPASGQIGVFLRSWYSKPILDHVYGIIGDGELEGRLERIARFEKCLADDGAVFLKLWLHLSRDAQKKFYKKWEKDPHESWRVTEQDWKHWHMYDRFTAAAERTIIRTSTGPAPWHIVEGEDDLYRDLTVMTLLRDRLRHHLDELSIRHAALAEVRARRKRGPCGPEPVAGAAVTAAPCGPDAPPPPAAPDPSAHLSPPVQPSVLQVLDLDQSLKKKDADKALRKQTARLNALYRKGRDRGLSAVLVFEGWDAAGKGGAIRRVTAALDARGYSVIPIGAPTDEERGHHYLWRFWRHLQRAGRVTIFDRSWYGRVMVERVEGLASVEEWSRAYAEINDFEQDLTDHGILLNKYFLHIDKDEQLRRFERRQSIPYKRWKLTEEDWRNREKWDDYEAAINDMVQRTSTRMAPWILVEGNDKKFARVKVLTTLCDRLEEALASSGKAAARPRPARAETPKAAAQ
jgi:polyphosphate kinase 2 (PPK2 family)